MIFGVFFASLHCAAQSSENVVNVDSVCLMDLGKVLDADEKHKVASPALPVVDSTSVTRLRQSSWPQTGYDRALRITQPGKYVLDEDIVFDFPETPKNLTSPMHWGNVIGISIEVSGVELDMNDHSLSMTDRFMRRQRFWNHIQLNNIVFRKPQGLYLEDLVTPSDITIKNGKFGQSSHMGIQGIENARVLLENLSFANFEVAAISCKDCNDVTIRRVVIDNTNLKVPANSFFAEMWSSTRYIHKHKADIRDNPLMKRAWLDMSRKDWLDYFNNDSDDDFKNNGKLPQGSIFGIQLKTTADRKSTVPSERALLDKVQITNVKNGEGVRVGLSFKGKQILCQNQNTLDFNQYFHPDGTPKEINGMANDAVIFRACLVTASEDVPKNLVDYVAKGWVGNIFEQSMDENGTKLKKYFGTDIRGHEPVGAVGIRVKGYKSVILRNIKINGISNGETGANLGDQTHLDMFKNDFFSDFPAVWQGPDSSQSVFKQANAYGVTFDGVTNGVLSNVEIENVESKVGLAFGVAIGGKTSGVWLDQVSTSGITVEDSNAGKPVPFLRQKAMPIFIEEGTQSIEWRDVAPVSSWVAPMNPDSKRNWTNITPKAPQDCVYIPPTTTTTKPSPGGSGTPGSAGGTTGSSGGTTGSTGGTTGSSGGTTGSTGGTTGNPNGNGKNNDESGEDLTWLLVAGIIAGAIFCCCCTLLCIIMALKHRKSEKQKEDKNSPRPRPGSPKSSQFDTFKSERDSTMRNRGKKGKKHKASKNSPNSDGKSPRWKTTMTGDKPYVASSHARANLQASLPERHPKSAMAKESLSRRTAARQS